MRIQFGTTWWGNKWVTSIEDATLSNRLPRGKSYAGKGAVKNIEIEDGKVIASVKGSRPKPYDIKISLKHFNEHQKQNVISVITENSGYLASLLVHKLPEQLFYDCEKQGIDIFPKRWTDFTASCSCPDWADCCKHIAAVIYLIGNEIDRNPFISFLLHGLDIEKELKNKGNVSETTTKNTENTVRSINDIFEKTKAEKKDWFFQQERTDKIDFTMITHCKERLFQLLPDNPLLGSTKNFKTLLSSFYNDLAREAGTFLLNEQDIQPKEEQTDHFVMNTIRFMPDLTLQFISFKSPGKHLEAKNIGHDLLRIMDFVTRIPFKNYCRQERTLLSLAVIVRFALQIIEKGAFIPEIIQGCSQDKKTEKYRIRYVPAIVVEEVKMIFEQIEALIPDQLIDFQKTSSMSLSKKETINILFTMTVEALETMIKGRSIETKTEKMFFAATPFIAESFTEKEIPHTIHLWLSHFHLEKSNHTPVIVIDEKNNNFILDIAIENKHKLTEKPFPFHHLFIKKKYNALKLEILKTLELLREHFPDLSVLLQSKGQKKLMISSEYFSNIFFKILPILRLLQIRVLLPKGLREIFTPRIAPTIKKKLSAKTGKGYLSFESMLDFHWKVALGSEHLSFEEFMKLVKEKRGILKIKEKYLYLGEQEIQKIIKHFENSHEISANQKLQTIFAGEFKGTPILLDDSLKKEIERIMHIPSINVPNDLNATLRPYQRRGYEWLNKNAALGFGSLIADDMGLGKTIQVISLLLALKKQGRLKRNPALVVAPTSLLTNWSKELSKFAPILSYGVYHGNQRKLEIKNKDLLLISYSLARKDFAHFENIHFSALIIDEAQNIKNAETNQTKAIKALKSDIRIAMTGTPVENRLSEYWSIIDFLNKGYLGSATQFREQYALPIEKDRDQKKLERFRKVTAPFILRRLKTDKTIIHDLPKKMEIDEYCTLSKDQASLYQGTLEKIMEQIASSEGIERKGLVLKLITALKQICNHPSHYLKKNDLSIELSGKTGLLMELLSTMYENNEKVLIFTQYTQMGELLTQMISKHLQEEVLFFHGGISRKKRDEMIETFQNNQALRTMILSLKAGGVGLNLTAARNIIHFDLWWNPAVEAQATDRAYRIGQKKNVMVHRLITKGTFEEKIDAMMKDKKQLANLAVAQGEKWIGEWSNTELKEIFKLSSGSSV